MNIHDACEVVERGRCSGDPGAIVVTDDDVLYGVYGLSLLSGAVEQFPASVQGGNELAEQLELLRSMRAGSAEFDDVWRYVGTVNPRLFTDLQTTYVARTMLWPAVDLLRDDGLDVGWHDEALLSAILAVALRGLRPQEVFAEAAEHLDTALADLTAADDEELVNAVYDVLEDTLGAADPMLEHERADVLERLLMG